MNKNSKCYLLSLILFLIVITSIYSKFIHLYIWGNEFLFRDFQNILESSICYPEIDIYTYNPCTILGGNPYSYGSFSLRITPYAEKFFDLYMLIIPATMIFFSIFVIVKLFNPKKIIEYFLVFTIIFSTPIMLGFERGQLELLIFIVLYFVSVSRNMFVEIAYLIFLSSLKFYPAICFGVYFNKKINFKFVLYLLLFLVPTLTIFYFDKENIIKVSTVISNYGAGGLIERVGMHVFSFKLLPTLSSLTLLHLENVEFDKEYFSNLSYIITLIILTFTYVIFIIKFFIQKKDSLINFNFENYEDKLFIMSSLIVMTLYFLFQGYSYKEIYVLGLVPFLLKNSNKNYPFIKHMYYIILIKFIFLTILWIIQTTLLPNSLFIKGFNILNKGLIDSILIFYISIYLIIFLKRFFEAQILNKS